MVDMSPKAVGERLRLMGELWELSMKFMESKKVSTPESALDEPRQESELGAVPTGLLTGNAEVVRMNGILDIEEMIDVGNPVLLESNSPENAFAVFFEDDGDTGYFYAFDTEREVPILDALHIYNVCNVTDRDVPSKLQIAWSRDGLKAGLLVNDYVHAVFDFESSRGYCRTGFPPPDTNWTIHGHEWSDEAYKLFS